MPRCLPPWALAHPKMDVEWISLSTKTEERWEVGRSRKGLCTNIDGLRARVHYGRGPLVLKRL